jgi:hypothetical protein
MADSPSLRSLFYRDPTRPLEEVQKVNATADAERDVEEFCETESAKNVLNRLSKTLRQDARLPTPRFLYLHATFGSGKTHLLKLIGYATGQTGVSESVVSKLSARSDSFQQLRSAIEEASTDRFVPVFLNLLNRDASKKPPIPVLVYEAIGDRMDYPTDPRWMTEFLLQLEAKEPSARIWEQLRQKEIEGRSLLDKQGRVRKENRGYVQTWLYEQVPPLLEDTQTSWGHRDVKEWVQQAEKEAEAEHFGAKELQNRAKKTQSLLTPRSGQDTELLIGLDEIALFIGDERSRYDELQETMQVLIEDPNPVVLGTGQWGLKEIHRDFVGEPDPEAWYSQEVGLEGADTEEIVQRRWLRKKEGARSKVQDTVAKMPSRPDPLKNGQETETNHISAYPLRSGDLRWVRQAMQKLLTRGRRTATEHIQGRALLVLVRALFVRRGWADAPLGALVPWSDVFAVLQSETSLVPTWVEELLTRLQALDEEIEGSIKAAAQTVFLLNQASIPATEKAVTYLLLEHVEEDVEARTQEVGDALGVLDQKNYVFKDDKADPPQYRLLTEQEVTVAEKVEERAASISYPRLRSKIKEWLQQYESLLGADGNRREVAIGGERDVPLVVRYSLLQSIPSPSNYASSVALRVLVTSEEGSEEVDAWTIQNEADNTLENGLIVVELPANFEEELRRHVATGDVLESETRHFRELESKHDRRERKLRDQVRSALDAAKVVDAQENQERGTYEQGLHTFVAEEVVPRKFPKRKSLSEPLQPIDDGPFLAAFFRRDREWPLTDEDAAMLGVERSAPGLHDRGWAAEFGKAAESVATGKVLNGDQLISMIEDQGGAFLGTSVEALSALLLVSATSEVVQLRRDGELIRDPEEMGRAVSTKTDIRRLTLRLEPPPDKDAVEVFVTHTAASRVQRLVLTTPR